MPLIAPKTRLYLDTTLADGVSVDVGDKHSHYLLHVLRLKDGDAIAVFNGKEGEWQAVLRMATKKTVTLLCTTQRRLQASESLPDLSLIFAPIKQGRIDFLVEKACELGVTALYPVLTHYTMVSRVNHERLEAHAIEAAEQCERLSVPVLHPLQKLSSLLASTNMEERSILYCDESGQGEPIGKAMAQLKPRAQWAALIGPEGGFSPEERIWLQTLPHIVPLSLGPRILRADTAALAVLSCFQAQRGDWEIRPRFSNN